MRTLKGLQEECTSGVDWGRMISYLDVALHAWDWILECLEALSRRHLAFWTDRLDVPFLRMSPTPPSRQSATMSYVVFCYMLGW